MIMNAPELGNLRESGDEPVAVAAVEDDNRNPDILWERPIVVEPGAAVRP